MYSDSFGTLALSCFSGVNSPTWRNFVSIKTNSLKSIGKQWKRKLLVEGCIVRLPVRF